MGQKVSEFYKIYCERKDLFKEYGYDIEAEREFVMGKARPLEGRVLEIGTGKGYLTVPLAREGCHFLSMDVDANAQAMAVDVVRHLGLDTFVTFRVEDPSRLSFGNASFDNIISANTAHHFSHPAEFFKEILRILADRGKIVMSDFSEDGFRLVETIHEKEGRRHSRGHARLCDMIASIDTGFVSSEKYHTRFTDVYVLKTA